MAEASIPVDLFNPGQVFACLGFAEAADAMLGGAEACFDWSTRDVRFRLRAVGEDNPVAHVLRFVAAAEAFAEAPHGSNNLRAWNASWGMAPHELEKGQPYASSDPDSPATLVTVLRAGDREIRLEYWADATKRDNAKFWAGAGGYPGTALARDALELVRGTCVAAASDPFALAAPQPSSFRLDWRRDYVPIDAGFSLNKHGDKIVTVGYPLVELLGAIGLTHARPRRLQTKLDYRYGIVGTSGEQIWLPLAFLRAGLGASDTPFEARRFRMSLSWPGKEGQARAITQVTEESRS